MVLKSRLHEHLVSATLEQQNGWSCKNKVRTHETKKRRVNLTTDSVKMDTNYSAWSFQRLQNSLFRTGKTETLAHEFNFIFPSLLR